MPAVSRRKKRFANTQTSQSLDVSMSRRVQKTDVSQRSMRSQRSELSQRSQKSILEDDTYMETREASKRSNNLALMKKFVEMNPLGKNRYKDVGCLDATRVKLDYYGGEDYIHANYVGTPTSSRRFICTQGAKKCFQYFPTSGSLTFGEITVTFAGSTMVCLKSCLFAVANAVSVLVCCFTS
ncbi:Protein-tyrosine phosphatase [Cooperia oncophora]